MNKGRKRKFVLPSIDFKKLQLTKFKFPKITKRLLFFVGISIISISIIGCVIVCVNQYGELKEIKKNMITIGENIQLGMHREFNLIDRLNILKVDEFKNDCEEFSFECIAMGSSIRKEFLSKLESENFSDSDIEVLNMVSSIDMSVKSGGNDYDLLVGEYNDKSRRFPIIVVKLFLKDLVPIL